jgi:hypothetical protein
LHSYNLNIADYNIRIESAPGGPELTPSERFTSFITEDKVSDLLVRVHRNLLNLPADAEKVFHAPLYEEINGKPGLKNENFWSIYKHRNSHYIKTIFPLSVDRKSAVLRFSLTSREWDLYIDFEGETADPLEYPLDSLVLYYLTAISGDIMIHASGVNHSGYGYIFSGVSGRGKTTIARLWNDAGGRVIHDDRLIIRRIDGQFRMFNTPVYRNDTPSSSKITRIYLIDHGKENLVAPVKGAAAVSLLIANCIQHNWDTGIVARLMGSVSLMCNVIPVIKLYFRPDRSVIDFLHDYE